MSRIVKICESEIKFREELDKTLKGFFGNNYRKKLERFCGIPARKIKNYFNLRNCADEVGQKAKQFIELRG
jgi:hypothetical protein